MRIQLPKTDPKTPNFGEIWRNLARMAFFVTVDSTIIAKNQFSGVLRPKESSHAFCIYLPQRGYKSRLSGGSGVSPICLTCLTWLALSLHPSHPSPQCSPSPPCWGSPRAPTCWGPCGAAPSHNSTPPPPPPSAPPGGRSP